MRDLWATIGACCIDDELREEIAEKLERVTSDRTVRPLELIQKLLRKRCGLNLSRWELKELQRFYGESYNYQGDSSRGTLTVLDMMKRAGHFMKMSVDASDRELCAALGLACIDESYRRALYNACDQEDPNRTAKLAELLQENEEYPCFRDLGQQDLQRLNRAMARGKKHDGKWVWQWMNNAQATGWESPTSGGLRLEDRSQKTEGSGYTACNTGYHIDDGEYLHVSQPKLTEALGDSIEVDGKTMTLQDFLEKRGVLS